MIASRLFCRAADYHSRGRIAFDMRDSPTRQHRLHESIAAAIGGRKHCRDSSLPSTHI
jgi:hypothetical protein